MTLEEKRARNAIASRKYRAKHPDRAKASVKKYGEANPGVAFAIAKRRKEEGRAKAAVEKRMAIGRERLNRLKSEPCLDCGVSYPPYVMDFDHVRGEKIRTVGLMSCYSEKRLLAEIAKCDLVCSNCHRIRTHNRRKQGGSVVQMPARPA